MRGTRSRNKRTAAVLALAGLAGIAAGEEPEVVLPSQVYGLVGNVNAVEFCPAGECILVGGASHAAVIDAETGEVLTRFFGHGRQVSSVAFSPDGSQALT
ncbi:MAG: WD40 repeat domain-containing protein, partial [Candidatus Hydrogenedentota bacterium]